MRYYSNSSLSGDDSGGHTSTRAQLQPVERVQHLSQAAAVLAMITLKTGEGDIEEAAQLVEALQDPSAEGGVRYEDRSDGEELARYGTECTTGSTQGAILHDVGAAIRHVRELNAFYDGLWDPEAQKTETHKQRAKAVVEKLMAVVAKDLEGSSDWGEDWYKMRDAQCNKLALLTPYQESGYDGLSCLVRLPPQGSTQVLQVGSAELLPCCRSTNTSTPNTFSWGTVLGAALWVVCQRWSGASVWAGFRLWAARDWHCQRCAGRVWGLGVGSLWTWKPIAMIPNGAMFPFCIPTLPLQWTRYSLYKHTHVSHYSRSAPFVAGGLVWWVVWSGGWSSARRAAHHQGLR